MNYKPTQFSYLPEVVKNLLIINGLFFLATYVMGSSFDVNLVKHLGLHNWQSQDFRPHQLVTHLFMHGGIWHILFNMFALWMFGNQLENVWGGKRFLNYFMITGLGAAALHLGVTQLQISIIEAKMTSEQISIVAKDGYSTLMNGMNFTDPLMRKLNSLYHTPTVGASGAVFGLLLAFGMLFPNTELRILTVFIIFIVFGFNIPNFLFFPLILIFFLSQRNSRIRNSILFSIPIKAKYFVIIYGIIELWSGIQNNPNDNVAHFAHLGGMIFGYFLIKFWRKNSQHFY